MDILSGIIADFILFIGRQAQTFWLNLELLDFSWPQIIADIVLVAIIIYFIFSLLKGSRAVNVLIGLGIVTFIYFISGTFQLVTLRWLMERFYLMALIAIPIIFQKELRMGLEKLGNTKFFLGQNEQQVNKIIKDIVEASTQLAEKKEGALIVLQGLIPLKEYIETGIPINAEVSRELLTTIFHSKSPLHDGAVILAHNQLKAASCILPHNLEEGPNNLGTRHKAALGLAESTDAAIVVVSEEKGTISFARAGKIEQNVFPEKLKLLLEEHLKKKNKK
jgi:diadenylate cyclase